MIRPELDLKKIFRDYFEAVAVAVVVAVVLRVGFLGTFRVPTQSMYPALVQGDFIFSYKWSYGWKLPFSEWWIFGPWVPDRGDVVVFRCPHDPQTSCLKRVVGLPGETIQIDDQNVQIDSISSDLSVESAIADDFPGALDYFLKVETVKASSWSIVFRKGHTRKPLEANKIPEGYVFVLGDSRDMSEDSRQWGAIPIKSLEGRAARVWLSLDWNRLGIAALPTPRWNRIMHSVQ